MHNTKLLLTFSFIILMVFSVNGQKKVKTSRWKPFIQSIKVETDKKAAFKFRAAVKLMSNDSLAWGSIWVNVKTKNEEPGFYDNMYDRPITSNEWRYYEIDGFIDSNSKALIIGGLCKNNGAFYFDDFSLSFQNEKGDFEPYKLLNSDFENVHSENVLAHWSEGYSTEKTYGVKGFNVSLTNDAVQGKKALLIKAKGIEKEVVKIGIKGEKGSQVQIEAMISMLEDLKERVERKVKNMSQYQIDHLHDEKANRIGALIMHLAAAEVYYQVFTFESRGFNPEEQKQWEVALSLDQAGRDQFQGKDIQYYLDIYNKVRQKTIRELRKRDDQWFQEVQKVYGWSNQYCWFHVMEHQSSHLGQILFLSKRIPPEPKKTVIKESFKG
ncbi:DinB family protein [Tenacibaculum sp. C7A-26P2]|uniref:DinB family protein n=1 Tax=Tenacibaculum sp. C7A-26P2 TaxID=3447504 RepID=UPI003F82DAA3